MSDDLFPPSPTEMIACVEREIGLRQQVYPRRIATGRMSPVAAAYQLRVMRAVLQTLKEITHATERGHPPPAA